MKITKRQLNKIILENLLFENALSRVYIDSGNYKFEVSEDGTILYLGRGSQSLPEPQEITGDQKVKVAQNLIRDELEAGRKVTNTSILMSLGYPDADLESDSDLVREKGYTYQVTADGRFIVLTRGSRTINKELVGDVRKRALLNLFRSLSTEEISRYPHLKNAIRSTHGIQSNDENQDQEPGTRIDSVVEYWPGFDKEILISAGRGDPSDESDMIVGACTQSGCAQWVGATIGDRIGNAWHALNRTPLNNKKKFSAFDNMTEEQLQKAAKIFSKINEIPERGDMDSVVRDFVGTLIPDQSQFQNLELGDIVGLTFYSSTHWTEAFYESATGRANYGTGSVAAKGPFFARADTGERWSPDMIGQNIQFRPGTAWRDQGAGTNFTPHTHVGIVGAKYKGVPIIYHTVRRGVLATGLNATKYEGNGITIVWAASNPNPIAAPPLEKRIRKIS